MTIGSIIHITAGTIGLLSGFFALATQKGKLKHREAGKTYLVSMVIMTLTGALLAYQASVNITVFSRSCNISSGHHQLVDYKKSLCRHSSFESMLFSPGSFDFIIWVVLVCKSVSWIH